MPSSTTSIAGHEPHVRYAKLARPRLHDALPRPRLFALLDALRARHRVLWIASPPGAGKTTLAASYLGRCGVPDVWCQIDQGDADPSTLFFFLSQATSGAAPAVHPEPEMAGDATRLQRMFFRDFYAGLPAGAIVVLDNLHEFDWDNAGQLLEFAFAEVPDGIHLLGLSRDAPPPRLSRMQMEGRLGVISWNEVRFDQGEMRALAQLGEGGGSIDPAWLDKVDGWAAGVVMLRSLQQQGGQTVELQGGRDTLFRYFAGEILERMPRAWQRLLLLLSALQGISARDAEELTGDPNVVRLLDQLYHNRLFVERRGTEVLTYHFHGLFREFLQHEARQRLDVVERHAFTQRAAALLDQLGQYEEAARLYQEAGAYGALLALLLQRASPMLSTGRGQAWREWMSWLPPGWADDEPWLRYWHGVSLSHAAPLLARKILVRAADMFGAADNPVGRVLTIAAIIDSFDFEWAQFQALPGWIADMQSSLAAIDREVLDPCADLKIHSRLVLALLLADPASPQLAPAARRALQLLTQVSDAGEQLAAGTILLRYFDSVDNAATANWLVSTVSKLADDSALSPFHRVWWYTRVARWLSKDGNYDEARNMAGTAKLIVTNFELDPLLLQFLDLHHLLGGGELQAAGTLLDELRRNVPHDRVRDCVELHTLDAQWRSLGGDLAGALQHAHTALQMSTEAAVPATERARLEIFIAACHALAGNAGPALSHSEAACALVQGHETMVASEARQFVQAYLAAARGSMAEAGEHLRQAMASHRRRSSTTLYHTVPGFAGALAALALTLEIESVHVRGLIVRQRLTPPERYTPNWPWPVSVYTLGQFDLALGGTVTSPTGKAQQRPLLLLKALLAAGDAGKSQQSLASHLWPDADDAKSALNVTVHRLRKLLSLDEGVVVGAGKIALAPALVWSDVSALMELCERIEQLPREAPAATVNQLAVYLLGLYRGPFCEGDDDSWLMAARDRYRNRFLVLADNLGQRLEQLGEWGGARHLYLRALEAEPLSEAGYRGVMRCAHALGDPTAAYSAYRRCRETLSIVLGQQPSAETERLVSSLGLK